VTRLTDDGLDKDWARISPDGTKLLYCEANGSQWNIMLLRDVNVPAKTPLINIAWAPAWNENNNNFLYVISESGSYKILRSAITGGGKTYVTRNAVGVGDNNPTTRNGVILFDTTVRGQSQLVSMTESGTEITILGEGATPSWHPTEDRFVFIRNKAIYEMDMESTQVTQLYSETGMECYQPSYSGDGQYILFVKSAEEKVSGLLNKVTKIFTTERRWQLFTMKANGTNLSQLTSGNVSAISPTWDKNNNVYFISDATGKPEVYRARTTF
jgi:TolB protein